MQEQKEVFRKTSLQRISSPEQLNDYIKVSSPSIWLMLSAIIVLLVGVCIWGVFGTLESTLDTVAVVQGGQAICYLPPAQAQKLSPHMPIRIKGQHEIGSITSIGATPQQLGDDFDSYALSLGGFVVGDWVLPVAIEFPLPDGVYPISILVEQIAPVSLLMN